MASPIAFAGRKTAFITVAAFLLTGTMFADDKKPAPAPRPTPSRPAPAVHSAPAASAPSHSSGGGSAQAPVRSSGGSAQAPVHSGTPSNPAYNRSGGANPSAGGGNPIHNPNTGASNPMHTGGNSNAGTFGGNRSGTPNNTGGFNRGGGTPSNTGGFNRGGGTPSNSGGGFSRAGGGSPNGHVPYSPGAGHSVQHGNNQVAVRATGRPSEIHSRDMMIRRGPQGTAMRRTVVERNDRTYAFNRAGYGSVRAGYSYGGRDYVVRRYYVGGAAFPRYYQSYGYRGIFFDAYAPAVFYSPYYYGWAYRPWGAPIAFTWGWGESPWYGYYGGYFTPYQTYPSANLWLTDYLVSQTLEASYRERVESARAAQMQYNDQPPQQYAALTPDIKQQIAEEVQRQLSYEAAEAQQRQGQAGRMAPPQGGGQQDPGYTGVGRMIEDNKSHVLLSNANIDVTTLSGQECSISQGDAIAINPGQGGAQGETVQVRVLASAGGGCPANSVVSLSLQDLQEMVNHVRATIDTGLAAMQKDPKLPKPPNTVPTAAVPADFASAAPPADPNEAAELQRLNQEATVTEKAVVSDASFNDMGAGSQTLPPPQDQMPPPQNGGATQTTDLQLGMTPDQVMQALGKPTSNIGAGPKRILMYQSLSLKLVFTNGKLTEIQ